jgi:hypothetical protein
MLLPTPKGTQKDILFLEVFQTFNIEREIEIKIKIKIKSKSKRKRKQPQLHLSCALSLLYMASSIDVKKQTPHMIFNQYE